MVQRITRFVAILVAWTCSVRAQAWFNQPGIGSPAGSTGFFRRQFGLTCSAGSAPFRCEAVQLFAPDITALASVLPDFATAGSHDCSMSSLGPSWNTPGACKWVPQTFLGLLYDRGIELMRHNVPQRDAFQVFEHARLVFLQYQTCKPWSMDGTVDVPIAAEALYGYIFANLVAKYSDTWTSRIDIDLASERKISTLRAMAVNSVLDQSFPLRYELSTNYLTAFKTGSRTLAWLSRMSNVRISVSDSTFKESERSSSKTARVEYPDSAFFDSSISDDKRPLNESSRPSDEDDKVDDRRLSSPPDDTQVHDSMFVAARSGITTTNNTTNVISSPSPTAYFYPASDDDCNIESPSGTWQWRAYPYSPVNSPLQNCCASACVALLRTIGVTPTMIMMNTCCGRCNKYSCSPATSVSSSAAALMTVIQVPDLLNGYVTTVTINL